MITLYGKDELEKFIKENNLPALSGEVFKRLEERGKQLQGFVPVCELLPVFYYSRGENERYKHERADVLLKYDSQLLVVIGRSRDTTFELSLFNGINHPCLEFLNDEILGLETPNRMGKATPVKMTKWIAYLLKREDACQKYILEVDKRINGFLGQLNPYRETIQWGENY